MRRSADRASSDRTTSAGGQLLHPSDVKSSTTAKAGASSSARAYGSDGEEWHAVRAIRATAAMRGRMALGTRRAAGRFVSAVAKEPALRRSGRYDREQC